MTSQLTIDDAPARTQDLREHLLADLDTTADLPNESTADLVRADVDTANCLPDRERELATDVELIAAGASRVPEPLAQPLDGQPFAPMPRQRALGFFAFAACALVAIATTTMPRSDLSEVGAAPPSQAAQVEPIKAVAHVAAADTITQAPEPRKTPIAAAKPEARRGGASASLITFASRSLVTSEKAVAAVFILKRTKAATGNAVVRWAARSGSADAGIDFSDASGTVRFADGQRQRAIYVPLRNDLLKEGDETFKVCLRSAQQARISGGSCAETTIRDDDTVAPT